MSTKKKKKPKYEPGVIYKVHVVFERKGEDVEALLDKFKTHEYIMVEKKYIEDYNAEGRE